MNLRQVLACLVDAKLVLELLLILAFQLEFTLAMRVTFPLFGILQFALIPPIPLVFQLALCCLEMAKPFSRGFHPENLTRPRSLYVHSILILLHECTVRSGMLSMIPSFSIKAFTRTSTSIPWRFFFFKNHYSLLGQNLLNSIFLGKYQQNSMQMKQFSKLDCFWNLSLLNSSSNPKSSFLNSISSMLVVHLKSFGCKRLKLTESF